MMPAGSCYICRIGPSLLMALAFSASVGAENWRFEPRIVLNTIFTDNVGLAPDGFEDSDIIVDLSPGFTLSREAGRVSGRIDYQLQLLNYVDNSDQNDVNHQLRAVTEAELVADQLFLEARGAISQVSIDPGSRVALDTQSLTGNKTSVYDFGITPTFRNNFNGYVDLTLDYSVDWVFYDGDDLVSDSVSDVTLSSVGIELSNGKRFSRLAWNINYDGSETNRSDGENSSNQTARASAEYAITQDWRLIGVTGYEDSDFASRTNTTDGGYWSIGAGWSPSRFIDVSATFGPKDNEQTIVLSPSRRTKFSLSRIDRDVGSNPGTRLDGTISHTARNIVWTAGYSEDVTSNQETRILRDGLLLDDADTDPADSFGNPLVFDETFTLSDEEFLRKRFDTSISYSKGKTQAKLALYQEQRDFESSDDEKSHGANITVDWRLAKRTTLNASALWEQSEFEDERTDDLWALGVGATRKISREIQGGVTYRHLQRNSDDAANEYKENRFSIFLTWMF